MTTSAHHLLGLASGRKRNEFWNFSVGIHGFPPPSERKTGNAISPLHPHHTLPFLLEVSKLRPLLIISLFKYQTQQLASSPWLAANQSSDARTRGKRGRESSIHNDSDCEAWPPPQTHTGMGVVGWGWFSGPDSSESSPVRTWVSIELCAFFKALKSTSRLILSLANLEDFPLLKPFQTVCAKTRTAHAHFDGREAHGFQRLSLALHLTPWRKVSQ